MTLAPGPNDLTTLAAVKAFAKVPTSADDDLLQGMLTRMSRAALTWCSRDSFYGRTVTAGLMATQASYLIMPEFPVTSVSALGSIPAAAAPAPGASALPSGYLLEAWNGIPPGGAQRLTGYGYSMIQPGGIGCTYRVGYETIGEAAVIPATGPFTVAPAAPYGPAMVDSGVVLVSTGVPLTRVTGTPATGQYSFTQDAATGLWFYTFAAADHGAAVLLSYSFCPGDVFQVVTEWTAERYAYRDRKSETTRSLAGQQTAGYTIDALPVFVREILQQYQAVGPLF